VPNACETLVRWYLRFNGYLGVENFVVHEPRAGMVDQGTESDILAVRFPFSREDVGAPLQTDPRLLGGIAHEPCVDFVVAEVKGGNRAPLNEVWIPPADDEKVRRLAYLLRWLGPFQDEATITEVARELQARHRALRDGYSFRVIFFSKRHRRSVQQLDIPQITFADIADFFVNVRAACWPRYGLGARSDHHQWDPLILEAWRLGDPDRLVPPAQKEQDIIALLEAWDATGAAQARSNNQMRRSGCAGRAP